MLGNGFYNVEKYPGRYTKLVGSFGRPQLILQLRLSFADGTEAAIVSDGNGAPARGRSCSPLCMAARTSMRASSLTAGTVPASPMRDWPPATEVAGPGGLLRGQGNSPHNSRAHARAGGLHHPAAGSLRL